MFFSAVLRRRLKRRLRHTRIPLCPNPLSAKGKVIRLDFEAVLSLKLFASSQHTLRTFKSVDWPTHQLVGFHRLFLKAWISSCIECKYLIHTYKRCKLNGLVKCRKPKTKRDRNIPLCFCARTGVTLMQCCCAFMTQLVLAAVQVFTTISQCLVLLVLVSSSLCGISLRNLWSG